MSYTTILRPDLQNLVDQCVKLRDKLIAMDVISKTQQQSLELECEKSRKLKHSLENMNSWWMKREDRYKESLNNLKAENEELRCFLADMKGESNRNELLNQDRENEINLLRVQITQLRNEHEQQLMLRDKYHEDELFTYKSLLKDTNKKSSMKRNATEGKSKIMEKHPAFMNEKKERKKRKSPLNRFPALKIDVITHKKRKLFQEDKDIAVDII